MTITILSIVFLGWLSVCFWKLCKTAAENAESEAARGNIEPLNTLMDTEGGLK